MDSCGGQEGPLRKLRRKYPTGMNFSNVSTIKAEVAALVELQQYQSAEGIISLLLCSKSQARSQRDEAELIGILGTLF